MSRPDCAKGCKYLKEQKEVNIRIGKKRMLKSFVMVQNAIIAELITKEGLNEKWVPKAERVRKKG